MGPGGMSVKAERLLLKRDQIVDVVGWVLELVPGVHDTDRLEHLTVWS